MSTYLHWERRVQAQGCTGRWRDYAAFLFDVGEQPSGHCMIRRNVNEPHGPGNSYWGIMPPRRKKGPRTAYVESPDGEEIEIEPGGVLRFCKERGINYGLFCTMLRAEQSHHKGWTGWFEDEDDLI